jgi:hypothetical protein
MSFLYQTIILRKDNVYNERIDQWSNYPLRIRFSYVINYFTPKVVQNEISHHYIRNNALCLWL